MTLPPKTLSADAIRQSRSVEATQFSNTDRDWLEQIADESGVVYFMAPYECEQLQGPLQLTDNEIDVESRWARLAVDSHCLGLYLPKMSFLEVGCFRSAMPLTAEPVDSRHPVLAGAGRLICHHEFHAMVGKLKAHWLLIPQVDRPSFPLNRDCISGGIAVSAIKEFAALHSTGEKPHPQIQEFFKTAQQLLHHWDLHSLLTWDFPEPSGDSTTQSLPMELYLQRNFPSALSESTGEFERQVAAALNRRRNDLGTTDLLTRAESYAHFLWLHRLGLIIDSRTRATGASPLSATDRRGLFEDLTGFSTGHIRRLLDYMKQLKTGVISALPRRSIKRK